MTRRRLIPAQFLLSVLLPASALAESPPAPGIKRLEVQEGDCIALVGSGLGSRMNHFGYFETELYLRFPKSKIVIRNLCDEGNTPGFRPHPGRNHDGQFAFPGAKELVAKRFQKNSSPAGHFETPDQWLARLEADTVIAFFGFNSSFDGPAGLERFKRELEAFLKHTRAQKYNGVSNPQVALVSPMPLQDLSATYGIPDGVAQNANIALYTAAMRDVAAANGVPFMDLFDRGGEIYRDGKEYTVDGALLTSSGYRKLAPVLVDGLFKASAPLEEKREQVHEAVMEKNWAWLNDYKIPNGVHVYGRRYRPFGPANYPFELKKTREMTANRDRAIWWLLAGGEIDLAAADAKTSKLPEVKTNFRPGGKNGDPDYLKGAEAGARLKAADGYRIELFASEEMFPDLANPVQIAFDNKGRLWVATMPSYPHYRIGDPRPTDKLLILEDTDGDGRADKQTVFADNLHIPIGFEISHDGVYVSQSGSLVRLTDADSDDKADGYEVMLSGFDDHDTHHAISAFCADPSGAFVMCEGVFLHSNVETAYGPQRGTNGGFFRYSPQRRHLTRHSQFSIPNPWGVAYDDYGQDFFLHTSGPSVTWMTPGTVRARYSYNMKAPDILTSNKVRPTSGIEFVSSRHFPDEVQGDILLCNAIGYLGCKQHQLLEDGTGFTTKFRQNLFESQDRNFRPTDLEFAPDGSLYVIDWHNVLIGHMQHNARDPHRDHVHGRIYRVTYPGRPLVTPARIDGAPIADLLENLNLPEARSRYRTRRELRERDADEVAAAAVAWAAEQEDGHLKLEALWVTWGADRVSEDLLRSLLDHEDHRIRAAAVRVLRYNGHRIADQRDLLLQAAGDSHGRVRLEAICAASHLDKASGLPVLELAEGKGIDNYMKQSYEFAFGVLNDVGVQTEIAEVKVPAHLEGAAAKSFLRGAGIYAREAHCGTCHQENGKGLPDSGFPPLDQTKWVNGDPERLIKLTLKGLHGPIEVKGRDYPGQVPMTPFEALLNDREIADVLTYVRNSFGNKASTVVPAQVKAVRQAAAGQTIFYNPAELLKEHPFGK